MLPAAWCLVMLYMPHSTMSVINCTHSLSSGVEVTDNITMLQIVSLLSKHFTCLGEGQTAETQLLW